MTESETARLKRAAVNLAARVDASLRDTDASLALVEAYRRLAFAEAGPEERVKFLQRACRTDPYDWALRCELGTACMQAGKADAALDAFDAALALAPDASAVWFRRGNAIFGQLSRAPKARVAALAVTSFEAAARTAQQPFAAKAAALLAACYGMTVRPERHLLLGRLADWGGAIPREEAWIPFVTFLGLSMAYSIHRARPAGPRTDAVRAAHRSAFDLLLGGFATWQSAFPDDARLARLPAAVAILGCDDEALVATVLAESPRLLDPRLAYLFVRRRLRDFDIDGRRKVLEGLSAAGGLEGGLARELFIVLNESARQALARLQHDVAEDLWTQGLVADPHSPALRHNLALMALHRGDTAAFASRMEGTADLLAAYWLLCGRKPAFLRRLAAKHQGFSRRIRESLAVLLDAEGSKVEPGLLAAWAGETLASLVLDTVLLSCRGDALPSREVAEAVVEYLRALPAVADGPGVVPPILVRLLDPPLEREPALHYEVIGVAASAPPSEIRKKIGEAREMLLHSLAEAAGADQQDAAAQAVERLRRLDEAAAVLTDLERRRKYDADCLPPEEHAFHMARRQFVCDLHEFSQKLVARGEHGAARLLAGAYDRIPHAGIDAYFDTIQDGARVLIRKGMIHARFAGMLCEVQAEMEKEKWEEGYRLLRLLLGAGAGELAVVHYLVAICEMHLERLYVEKHGTPTAPGVPVVTGIRARVAASPDDPGGAADRERLLGEMLARVQAGEAADQPSP